MSRIPGIVVMFALLAACGGGGDGSKDLQSLPKPALSGLTSDFVLLAPGETWEATLQVDGEGGLPHPDYEANWLTDITTADGDVATETPAAGVERFLFTPKRLGVFTVQAKIQGRTLPDEVAAEKAAETKVVTLVVRGGKCTRIVPDMLKVELVVGETRPFSAEGLAELSAGEQKDDLKYAISQEELEFAVENSGIATWDNGALTGVAVGETKLNVTCGTAQIPVPVVVSDADVSPPQEGRVPMLTRQALAVGMGPSWPQAPDNVEGRLVLQSQSYPMALLQPYPGVSGLGKGQFGRLLVAQWTGSGFGTTALGTWWETIAKPRLALTDDRAYVAYMETQFPGAFLADRPLADSKAAFRLRVLPTGKEVEEDAARVFEADQAQGVDTLGTMAITASKSAVFVAYTLFFPVEVGFSTTTCVRKVRLVTATDLTLEASDIHEETYIAPNTDPDACKTSMDLARVARLHLLPPNFSSTLPRVAMLTGINNDRKVWYLDWNGVAWNAVAAVDPKQIEPEHVERAVPIDFTVPADGETTTFPAIWASNRNTQKREMWFWPMGMQDVNRWTSYYPQVEGGQVSLFSFMSGSEVFLGNIAGSFLARLDRWQRLVFEEPIWPYLYAEEDPVAMRKWPISGVVATDPNANCDGCAPVRTVQWIWHTGDQVEFVTARLPELLGGPENETRGSYWSDSSVQPTLLAPPAVLSDGSRMALVEYGADEESDVGAVAQLWRSDGPGFPFEHLLTDGDIRTWATAPVEVGDALYVVSSAEDTMRILKSKDEGETWAEFATAPCNGKVIASKFLEGGQVVAICAPIHEGDTRPFQTLYMSKLLVGVQINDVGGLPVGMEGPGQTLGHSVTILPNAEGFTVVLPVRGPGVGNAVLVRRYDLSGTMKKETMTALKGPFDPASVVETAAGWLVSVSGSYDNGNYTYVVVRSQDDFATQSVKFQDWTGMAGTPLPLQYDSELNTLYLFDGQWLSGDSRVATVRTSTDDGATWQVEPSLVRPWGGRGQQLTHVVREGAGWLVFFHDNSSLRAWEETDDFDGLFSGAVFNQVLKPPADLGYMKLVL